ncbi:unnamed protein product [Mytilus coruscus]|uniref:Ig-like domain-containing protein n=1 Tax=Mytilus coruscus TaxID=42192 RepID=A0A6J8ELL1_MYTCO|nr:unnamed protein product [Mytilus coruscus]
MTCPYKSFSPPIIWLGPVGGKLRTYSDGVNINRNIPNYDRIRTTGNHEKGEYNLKIFNLTLEDAGQYKCHSFINGSVLQAVYLLNILDKPKTPDDNRSFHFKAVIGKSAEVAVPVISLTEPVVSWTQNAGGRLGPWTALKNGSSQYRLHSTISSTSKTHIGIYGIKVRNDVDFPVTVVPENAYCNASTKLTLLCQHHFNDDKDWKSKWIHSRNGKFIKDIVGIVDFNTSIVDIKFCDYREEGEYECIWKSPVKEYSAASTVRSNGPPTLTGTECLIENFNICMAVRFYSADGDITFHWFRNDVEMVMSERLQVILFPTIVQLNYTNTQVQVEGYTSKLCISDMILSEVEPYSCQIVNNYGSIEYSFKKDDINQVYQHLSDVLSTSVTDVHGEPDQNEKEQDNVIIIGKVTEFKGPNGQDSSDNRIQEPEYEEINIVDVGNNEENMSNDRNSESVDNVLENPSGISCPITIYQDVDESKREIYAYTDCK